MTGDKITEWIDVVATGSNDTWFKILPIGSATESSGTLSWEAFARGWIHAAEGNSLSCSKNESYVILVICSHTTSYAFFFPKFSIKSDRVDI